MSLSRFYTVFTLLNIIGFSLLYIFIPGLRGSFIQEDKLMENLTSILFFNSFLLGVIFIGRLKKYSLPKIYFIIPLTGLLCFLDEISFGLRLFNSKPLTIGGEEVDGMHDLLEILYLTIRRMPKRDNYFLFAFILLTFGVVIFTCIKYRHYLQPRYVRKVFNNLFKNSFSKYPSLKFLALGGGFVAMSSLIDLYIIIPSHEFVFFLEELFEMNAALSLLFACFSIEIEHKKQNKFSRTDRVPVQTSH